jgi:hypothetical protein
MEREMQENDRPIQTVIDGVVKPPRPTISTKVIEDGVRAFCEKYGYGDDEMRDVIRVFSPHSNGYKLARELDDRCGWEISPSDVDTLDCVGTHVDAAHRESVRQWVADYDIKPELSIGTHIKRGVIAGIAGPHSPACYLVKEHGCTRDGRHLLIKFEDATA